MTAEKMAKINEFMFNKKESIVVPPFASNKGYANETRAKLLAGLISNLDSLGYEIPMSELVALLYGSGEELRDYILNPVIDAATKAKGSHVKHRLLFKKFPESVLAMDIDTMSDVRFLSYFTVFLDTLSEQDALEDGVTRLVMDSIEDKYTRNNEIHIPTANPVANRIIHLVSIDAYFAMVRNMLSSRASLSEYDKEIVRWTIENFAFSDFMPEKIPFNETLVFVNVYNFNKGYLDNVIIKNADDFERLLVGLSDGDITLSKKQKVRNFSNQERKSLWYIFLRAIHTHYESMLESFSTRRSRRFMDNVLNSRLHFNNVRNKAYAQFVQDVENHTRVMTAYEVNLQNGKYRDALDVLAQYSPTLMVQHARNIIAKAEHDLGGAKHWPDYLYALTLTLSQFGARADIKTLMSLRSEVTRDVEPFRIMVGKGVKPKVIVKENNAKPLSAETQKEICFAIDAAIRRQIGKLSSWAGYNVYIDKDLKDCPIPVVGRNDTMRNRSVQIGTRLPMQHGPVMRAGLYKKKSANDYIDFSAVILDEYFNIIQQVSWNNLKIGKNIAYHSGDTRYCQKGCTEVIDININLLKENFPKAKYIAYQALMWDHSAINSCEEIFMVFMPSVSMGKKSDGHTLGNNPVLNPKDVQLKIDVVGDKPATMPMMYDIDNQQVIIMNIEGQHDVMQSASTNVRHFDLPVGCEAIENYSTDIARLCFAYTHMHGPTIYELAKYHADYRLANIVDEPEKADIIFASDRISPADMRDDSVKALRGPQRVISVFDKDVITAEFLPSAGAQKATVAS